MTCRMLFFFAFLILSCWTAYSQSVPCGVAFPSPYRNIDAYSNGSNQGTTYSCASAGTFGLQYQCVEYVKRFYAQAMGMNTSGWHGNAVEYFNTAAAKGLLASPNGGEVAPAANDIIVFSGGDVGHVAIITSVTPTSVELIEQNWSPTGTASIALSQDNGHFTIAPRGRYRVLGWLRAPSTEPNQFPTAGFTMEGNGQLRIEGQTLNLTVAPGGVINVNFSGARSVDPDGNIVAWEWRINGTRVPNATFIGRDFVFGLGEGTHVVTLIVTDNRNDQSEVAAQGNVIISTVPQLFFDGSHDPRFFNGSFGEPVIDSQGNLVMATVYGSVSCSFGVCGFRLTSIDPTGTLNWLSPNLSTDPNAPGIVLLGPNDTAYMLATQNSIFAFNPNGSSVSGWPVVLPYSFGIAPTPVVVDPIDGTVYARTAVTQSFTGFPIAVTALNPDSSQKWQTSYVTGNFGGAGIIQGPGRNLFTYIFPEGIHSLDHNNGSRVCQTGSPGGLVADEDGIYSNGSGISVLKGDCSSVNVYSAAPGIFVDPKATDSSRIFALDYPNLFNADQVKLFAITKQGSLLWRNNEIVVTRSPVLKNNKLYVIGKDSASVPKLFVVDANNGQIQNSVGTGSLCENCGVAVANDGTIYVNDLRTTKIYKLN